MPSYSVEEMLRERAEYLKEMKEHDDRRWTAFRAGLERYTTQRQKEQHHGNHER